MKADLHMHSTNSDGRKTMRELVDLAQKNNVDIIAISDHDTVGDIDDAIKYGESKGITVLPAIELSTVEKNKSVHILGYFTDKSYHNEDMLAYYKDIKLKRDDRAKVFIKNLELFYGLKVQYENVQKFAHNIIARPHIAKAIHEAYPHYTHDYIFDHFIGDHCQAYVPSVELGVKEGLDLLKRNNCITVLAHPVLLKPYIKDNVLSYDYDGIEARYFQNKEGDEEYYRAFANERGLLITAGSDYHGIEDDTKHGEIGDCYIDGKDLDIFLKKLKKM
jgi:predicted metal-dependent phosphoesterase TrpH